MKTNIRSKPFENHLTNKEPISVTKRFFLNIAFAVLCFVVCFYFGSDLYKILQQPFNDVMQSYGTMMPKETMIIVSSPTELFMLLAKIALFGTAVFVLPLLFTQFYHYKIQSYSVKSKIKNLFALYLVALTLFLIGISLAFFLFVPLGMQAFASMLPAEAFLGGRRVFFSVSVLNQEMALLLGMGLLFQFPLLLWTQCANETVG